MNKKIYEKILGASMQVSRYWRAYIVYITRTLSNDTVEMTLLFLTSWGNDVMPKFVMHFFFFFFLDKMPSLRLQKSKNYVKYLQLYNKNIFILILVNIVLCLDIKGRSQTSVL